MIGAILALFGLALLSTAEGQPQAAIGVALFMGGTAVFMRAVSARAAIEDAQAAQAEALEDARDAAVKAHLEYLARLDRARANGQIIVWRGSRLVEIIGGES